jgi:aryl-alcohol dehydrogenase-like predicted oxidoreductase
MRDTQQLLTAAAAATLAIGGELTVDRLGFGAMRLTGDGVWGEPRDPDECRRALRRAVELDVNLIDTADSYGPYVSERLIAEALYPYPDDLVIATKGGLTRSGPNQWHPDGRPDHLREACEGSLARLRVECIDLYQLHRVARRCRRRNRRGLVELRDAGKIMHIGLSNVSVAQLGRAREITPIVSVQNRHNLADRASEDVLASAERAGGPPLSSTRSGSAFTPARLRALSLRGVARPAPHRSDSGERYPT